MLSGNNKLSDDLKLDYRAGAIMQRIDNTVDFNIADGLNVTNKFALAYATNPAFANAALIPYYVSQETHSVFGQANPAYKEVLFLEATIRNDWDSRLATPYTITYPSVGLSGIISDMTTLPSAISFLKLSSSYAVVGNGGVPQSRFNFLYLYYWRGWWLDVSKQNPGASRFEARAGKEPGVYGRRAFSERSVRIEFDLL